MSVEVCLEVGEVTLGWFASLPMLCCEGQGNEPRRKRRQSKVTYFTTNVALELEGRLSLAPGSAGTDFGVKSGPPRVSGSE